MEGGGRAGSSIIPECRRPIGRCSGLRNTNPGKKTRATFYVFYGLSFQAVGKPSPSDAGGEQMADTVFSTAFCTDTTSDRSMRGGGAWKSVAAARGHQAVSLLLTTVPLAERMLLYNLAMAALVMLPDKGILSFLRHNS
jgi:hypothetical protein